MTTIALFDIDGTLDVASLTVTGAPTNGTAEIDLDTGLVSYTPDPDWEGTDVSEQEDLNGVRLGQGLLEAARAGGGFVEYNWDNPAIEGDEEDGSPKLAYAVPITVGEEPMLLGSGIYVDTSEQ